MNYGFMEKKNTENVPNVFVRVNHIMTMFM